MPASAPVCAENVASGWQYWPQPAHPLPVSHASKNNCAVFLIAIAFLSSRLLDEKLLVHVHLGLAESTVRGHARHTRFAATVVLTHLARTSSPRADLSSVVLLPAAFPEQHPRAMGVSLEVGRRCTGCQREQCGQRISSPDLRSFSTTESWLAGRTALVSASLSTVLEGIEEK